MNEDSSLEEFAAGTVAEGERAESTEENGGSTQNTDAKTDSESSTSGGDDSGVEDSPEEAVTPTASTYGYSPGKAACGACGTRVRRRWRDEDDMLCGECKEW
jgi:hypothetical protein